MSQRLVALLAFILAAAPCSATAADDVWSLLGKPGHIVLLRHSNAPGSVPESNDMDFSNCAIQRNLDEEGRAQAARIGDEFRKHKIRKANIVSSQYCRAVDTSKLLKHGPVVQSPLFNQTLLSDPAGMEKAGAAAIAYIKKLPPKQLTILVTHVTNIQSIAGVSLDPGEFAVVHFDAKAQVVVDGRIAVP